MFAGSFAYWVLTQTFLKFQLVIHQLSSLLIKPVHDTTQMVNKSLIEWKETYQVTLGKLVSAAMNPLVLTYSDFNTNFILHVDSSGDGLR